MYVYSIYIDVYKNNIRLFIIYMGCIDIFKIKLLYINFMFWDNLNLLIIVFFRKFLWIFENKVK